MSETGKDEINSVRSFLCRWGKLYQGDSVLFKSLADVLIAVMWTVVYKYELEGFFLFKKMTNIFQLYLKYVSILANGCCVYHRILVFLL